MNVIELRNYLLKPAARDKFIGYFKAHFIETQNVLGASTPGQFRIRDEDNRFFWIRGFNSLQERSKFLPSFYGGDVWNEFGPAANDMMLEWHNVHLLKSAGDNTFTFDKKQELLVIDYYTAGNNQLGQLIDLFKQTYIPLCHSYSINNISLWVSEMSENDFPKLPVYQQENLLVVMTGYNNEAEYKSLVDRFNYTKVELISKRDKLVQSKNSLVLYPT